MPRLPDVPRLPNKLNNTPRTFPIFGGEVKTGKLLNCLFLGAYNVKTIRISCNLKTDLDRAKVGHSSDMIFVKLQLHDAICRLRFYSNSLIHILSLSNWHNNVASIQKNRGDKSRRVIVALAKVRQSYLTKTLGKVI